jgi:hypothetical protein
MFWDVTVMHTVLLTFMFFEIQEIVTQGEKLSGSDIGSRLFLHIFV